MGTWIELTFQEAAAKNAYHEAGEEVRTAFAAGESREEMHRLREERREAGKILFAIQREMRIKKEGQA